MTKQEVTKVLNSLLELDSYSGLIKKYNDLLQENERLVDDSNEKITELLTKCDLTIQHSVDAFLLFHKALSKICEDYDVKVTDEYEPMITSAYETANKIHDVWPDNVDQIFIVKENQDGKTKKRNKKVQ